MKNKISIILILMFSFIVVNASSFKVDCPEKDKALGEVKCDVSLKSDLKVKNVSFNYNIVSGSYADFSINENYTGSVNQNGVVLSRREAFSGSSYDSVGSLVLKMGTSSDVGITFSNIRINNEDVKDKNKTIKLYDSNNYLSDLSVSGYTMSPVFNKSVSLYTIKNVDASSIVINASSESKTSTVTGGGKKNLNIGLNEFTITVTSEMGIKRTYTLKIYRNGDKDKTNTLSSLSIGGYQLSPSFDKKTTSYKLTVKKDVTSIKVNASLSSDKSSFNNGNGPRVVSLNYGNNDVVIEVKSESGSIKRYTIKVVREDERSSNNYLKSLNVTAGDFDFDKKTLNYSFSVPNDTTSIKVIADVEDDKSSVSGNKTYDLKEGVNTIEVNVTAENGSMRKYTLKVTRIVKNKDEKENNYLESLEIENYQIMFDKDTSIYNVTIDNEKKLNIKYKVSSQNASVIVNGNENLKNGSIIRITVRGVDGSTREYIINISKNETISKDNKGSSDGTVILNQNRKLHIVLGVISFVVMVVSIVGIAVINVKRMVKKGLRDEEGN